MEKKMSVPDSPEMFGSRTPRAPSTTSSHADSTVSRTKVIITDVQMPFGSMVTFMVKWAFAAIPALIILLIIGAFTVGLLGGLFRVH